MSNIKKLNKNKRELLRRKAKTSLIHFIMYNNNKYDPNWHHIYLCKVIDEFLESKTNNKLIISLPPQHGKSEIVSRNLPAYLLGREPDKKIAGVSYSSDLAKSFNVDCQRIMENREYSDIFPKSALTDNNTIKTNEYFVVPKHKGYYKSVGITGGLSGFPVDVALLDDLIKDALQAYSKVYRDRAWDWYMNVLYPRLHNASKQIVMMTRWHEDDPIGRLLRFQEDWQVINIPAIKEDNEDPNDPRLIGQALWQDKHSLEKTLKIKAMSERTFNSLYQGHPKAIEGDILKRQWFKRFEMSEIIGLPVYFKIDTAYTEKERNDPSGIMAYTIKDNNIYILNFHKGHYQFPDLCQEIINQVNLYGNPNESIIRVEPKASGKSVIQDLKRNTLLNIDETPPPIKDKEARTNANSFYVSSGRVHLLNNASWIDNWLDIVCGFPNVAHDEEIDCLNMAIEEITQPAGVPDVEFYEGF